MAKKLKCYTVLRETPLSAPVFFGPDSVLPDWAVKATAGKDHLFTEDDGSSQIIAKIPNNSEEVPPRSVKPTGSAQVLEPAGTELGKPDTVDPEAEDVEEPRRNASELAWREFAEDQGVPVTEAMGRDDIVSACEEAGVIEAK